MNHTVVELARAMLIAAQLPEFLWKHTVTHAAYIRNRTYMQSLGQETPYQQWYSKKPDVTHLQEFGSPVWMLLQGQKIQHKLLPKSQ
jgi:hypothetical protein